MHIRHSKRWKVDSNFKWSEWLKANKDLNDMCDPPLSPQMALDILYEYLLPEYSRRSGSGYLTAMPESVLQVNTIVVDKILRRYSKEYQQEIKLCRKVQRKKLTAKEKLQRLFVF